MVLKNIPFALAITLGAALVVGCGETTPTLTKEEVAYVRQKRLQEMYGGGSTSTSTQTIRVSTTVTISTTVTTP
jgi:hypothetical protein